MDVYSRHSLSAIGLFAEIVVQIRYFFGVIQEKQWDVFL